MKTFVDKNGMKLADYDGFCNYYIVEENLTPTVEENLTYIENEVELDVCLLTRHSGVRYAYKITVTCEDVNTKYHGLIREVNGEQNSIYMHNAIKKIIEAGDDIPENDDLVELYIIE